MSCRRRAIAVLGAIRRSFADHEAIVEALGRRDRRAAMRAIRTHLERIYRTTRIHLDADALAEAGRTRTA